MTRFPSYNPSSTTPFKMPKRKAKDTPDGPETDEPRRSSRRTTLRNVEKETSATATAKATPPVKRSKEKADKKVKRSKTEKAEDGDGRGKGGVEVG
jgi:hypothetical protein